MVVQAIRTNYKGFEFRSRLEARWAVFFDALDVRWEYEAEGYDLPSGWYVPDFWLPDHNLHFEVKPKSSPDAFDKCCDLALATELPVCMSLGQPAHPVMTEHGLKTDGHMGIRTWDDDESTWWALWDLTAWHEVFDEHWPHRSRFWPLPVGLGELEIEAGTCERMCGWSVEAALTSTERIVDAVETSRRHSFWEPK